jgi:carboxyl-terminal processing protease
VGRASAKALKPRSGRLGRIARILGGTVLACTLAFGSFVIYFTLAVYPKLVAKHAADAQRALAFAKLTGAARRLAIYDAFVAQIDRNYYDQSFSGFDWRKMKRDWRPRAAGAKDDTRLYFDVFFQMVQRFPSSHISFILPHERAATDTLRTPGGPSTGQQGTMSTGPKFGGDKDIGFQVVPVRRKGRIVTIVGEVWPGSGAAAAGITPGWLVLSFTSRMAGMPSDHVHVAATFFRLTPAQLHALEATGTVQVIAPGPGLSEKALQAKVKALQVSVAYDAKFTGSEPSFISRRLPDRILYIRFDHFDSPSLQKVAAALKTAGSQGAILDLRYNTGGYVMPLLNALLPGDIPVYKQRSATGERTVSTAFWTHPYSGPLAVLTGPASASAAEIAASVLKSRHRAILVGRATNGSVLGSQYFPLPDGGQVQVAVDDIETMGGKRLENIGVTPDIDIYPTLDAIRAGRDMALEAAEASLSRARTAEEPRAQLRAGR